MTHPPSGPDTPPPPPGPKLTREDCELIVQSLRYTREAFERYAYPTEQGRQERLADVDRAVAAVRALRRVTS